MELKRFSGPKWKQEDSSTIVRRYSSLSNSCIYQEDITVEAASNRNLDFQIDMKGEMCNWSTFNVR